MAIIPQNEAKIARNPGGDESLKIRNGVVDDTYVYYVNPLGKLVKTRHAAIIGLSALPSAAAIMQIALTLKLKNIWVVGSSFTGEIATRDFVEKGLPIDGHTKRWKINNPQYTATKTPLCKFVKGWKLPEHREPGEDGREIGVGFVANGDWTFRSCSNPVALLGAISYLEDAIGLDVAYSPSSVGRRLMQKANSRGRAEWIAPIDIRKWPRLLSIPHAIDFARPLTKDEMSLPAVVVYDGNSRYPASCTGVLLGSGEPDRVEHPQFDTKNLQPGIWNIRIVADPVAGYPSQLPHPIEGKREGWYWTYTVKFLLEMGFQLEISEAYIWPHERAHTILRYWASDLWHARCQLNSNHPDCNVNRYRSNESISWAYESVKQVMNSPIGLLAHTPDKEEWSGARDWYRPDWNALIVDKSRYEVLRRVHQVWAAYNIAPIGIDNDALFYAAPTYDHEKAIPGMLNRSTKLGGYKRKFAHHIPLDEISFLFNRGDRISRINTFIEAMGGK